MKDTERASLAGDALVARDIEAAFRHADRQCRIDLAPNARHLTVLAFALHAKGEWIKALETAEAALELDPEQISAARYCLAHAPTPSLTALRAVFRFSSEPALIAKAASLLLGQDRNVLVDADIGPASISLRIAARKPTGLTVSWRDGIVVRSKFEWRSFRRHDVSFAETRLDNRPGGRVLDVTFGDPTETFSFVTSLVPVSKPAAIDRREASRRVCLIIPIYGDAAATKACLESVEAQITPGFNLETILVEDASPDPDVVAVVQAFAARPHITLIRNEHNLGFVGAVNRGLTKAGGHDVVLLNADTVLPGDAIARLRETAAAHDSVGTLTPFTNNGQYFSFPRPFDAAELPGQTELERLAHVAWRANGTAVVDAPSGIGFCLYVRQACLLAIGGLDPLFRRGYYEDVDLCQRASEAGWRNVCATGVFVGHAGSRSFGTDKGHLVARNKDLLERRYPGASLRSAAFVEWDPLLHRRAAIEEGLMSDAVETTLLICADETSRIRANEFAARTPPDRDRYLIAEAGTDSAGRAGLTKIFDPTGRQPQNLSADIGETLDRRLEDLKVKNVVIFDPAGVDLAILDAVEALELPIEMRAADAGLFCPRRHMLDGHGRHCGMPDDPATCDTCLSKTGSATRLPTSVAAWRSRWAHHANRKKRTSPGEPVPREEAPKPRAEPTAGRAPALASLVRVGLIVLEKDATDLKLIQSVARRLCGDVEGGIVVLGSTVRDERLLAMDDCWVTGPIKPVELAATARRHGVTHFVAATRKAIFEHPLLDAIGAEAGPLARIMPQHFRSALGPHDHWIDAGLDDQAIGDAIFSWIEGHPSSKD